MCVSFARTGTKELRSGSYERIATKSEPINAKSAVTVMSCARTEGICEVTFAISGATAATLAETKPESQARGKMT